MATTSLKTDRARARPPAHDRRTGISFFFFTTTSASCPNFSSSSPPPPPPPPPPNFRGVGRSVASRSPVASLFVRSVTVGHEKILRTRVAARVRRPWRWAGKKNFGAPVAIAKVFAVSVPRIRPPRKIPVAPPRVPPLALRRIPRTDRHSQCRDRAYWPSRRSAASTRRLSTTTAGGPRASTATARISSASCAPLFRSDPSASANSGSHRVAARGAWRSSPSRM